MDRNYSVLVYRGHFQTMDKHNSKCAMSARQAYDHYSNMKQALKGSYNLEILLRDDVSTLEHYKAPNLA